MAAGILELLWYQSNTRTHHLAAVFFLVAGAVGLFKGTRGYANFVALILGLLVFWSPGLATFAVLSLYVSIPILVFLLLQTDIDRDLAVFFRLPKRPVPTLLMSTLVLGGLVAIGFAAILVPSHFFVKHEAGAYRNSSLATLSVGNTWLLGGVEEFSRVGLQVMLPGPVPSSLLWSLAHRHDAKYWEEAWERSFCLPEEGCIAGSSAKKSFAVATTYGYAAGMILQGVLLLWLINKTRSIWPSVICHVLYNALVNLT
jgi:membrane protease YdiL (CAAX protease family)